MMRKHIKILAGLLVVFGLALTTGVTSTETFAFAAGTDAAASSLTITTQKEWAAVHTNNEPVPVYTDAATTKPSGVNLTTPYSTWKVTRTAAGTSGKVVAYDLGSNQWVKAADVTPAYGSNLTVSDMPQGSVVYSDFKDVTVYSDMQATKPVGKLSTSYDEWTATQVANDNYYGAFTYNLGNSQWVKVSDISLTKPASGVIVVNAGTSVFDSVGKYTGTITDPGAYKVFNVSYINGKQSLQVGDFYQWVAASDGAYYPD